MNHKGGRTKTRYPDEGRKYQINLSFGELLRIYCYRLGYNYCGVARIFGVGQDTVKLWINESRFPHPKEAPLFLARLEKDLSSRRYDPV